MEPSPLSSVGDPLTTADQGEGQLTLGQEPGLQPQPRSAHSRRPCEPGRALPLWACAGAGGGRGGGGQAATVRTSPGAQPFPALSVSLARVLLAPDLLCRRDDAI